MGRKAKSARSQAKLDDAIPKRDLGQNHTSPLLSGSLEELEEPSGNGVVEPTKMKRLYRSKESLMTVLCSTDKNIEALYHFFILMMLFALAYSLLQDSLEAGRLHVDLTYYFAGFGPPSLQLFTVGVWLVLQLIALAIYPTFKLWQWLYPRVPWIVNLFFIALGVAYNVAAHSTCIWVSINYQLSPVPSIFLLVEQLRFTMKSYSFIRENAYKVLYPWHKDDKSGPAVWYGGQMSPSVGSFQQYLYYLFCPTLLYRDHYPRNKSIRWLKVVSYIAKCCVSIAFVTILTKEIFTRKLAFAGSSPSSQLILSVFLSCCLWGLVYQFMAGYIFLHSWSNLFAELLRFADREFYSDWWTCTSYATFYRKWNLLVHEWIKAYIYQDFKDFFKSPTYNKLASLPTFFISAVMHEYMLWGPFRFFLPVMLIQFSSFGVLLYFIRPAAFARFWNYFIHFSLHLGVSIMVFCYAMERYARIICPIEENFVNTFVPQFYKCFIAGHALSPE